MRGAAQTAAAGGWGGPACPPCLAAPLLLRARPAVAKAKHGGPGNPPPPHSAGRARGEGTHRPSPAPFPHPSRGGPPTRRGVGGPCSCGMEATAPARPPHPQEEWRGEVVRLSWRPRAFLFKRFLSDEECDHLTRMVRVSFSFARVLVLVLGLGNRDPACWPGLAGRLWVRRGAAPPRLTQKPARRRWDPTWPKGSRQIEQGATPPAPLPPPAPATPQSRPSLTKSTVVDMATGKPMDSDVRTRYAPYWQEASTFKLFCLSSSAGGVGLLLAGPISGSRPARK